MQTDELKNIVKQLIYIAIKCLAVSFVLILVIFYFRLGFFLPFVYAIGLILAVLVTQSHWRKPIRRIPVIILVVIVYNLSVFVSWNVCFGHRSLEVHLMTWEIKETENDLGEPEVVLYFDEFPGNFTFDYSTDLANYLSTADSLVEVVFEVTYDLGCMRGFHMQQIGELTDWHSTFGGFGASGNSKSPWTHRWWCR